MSKIIASLAIRGAHQVVGAAQELVTKAVAANGADCPVASRIRLCLPVIYSLLANGGEASRHGTGARGMQATFALGPRGHRNGFPI